MVATTTGTATDFITFTRGSSATRVNASGLIETVASNTPRLDYSSAGVAKGLLVEEARTNLLLYSEQFDNAYWTKYSLATVTANAATAPDGTLTADRVTGSGNNFSGISKDVASTSGTSYTTSFFVKKDTANFCGFLIDAGNFNGWVNLATGAVNGAGFTATVTSAGSSFYRVVVSYVASATTNASVWVFPADTNSTLTSTSSIYIWGAQVEAGAFATSYIPTTTASVTRAADVASVATSSFPYSSTASSVVVAFQHIAAVSSNGNHGYFRFDRSGTEVVSMDRYDSSNLAAFRGLGLSVDTGRTITAGVVSKLGTAFTTGDVAVVVSNGSVYTNTSAAGSQVADALWIGRAGASSNYLNGWIRQITYIPRRLTNAELQARTV